MTTVADGARRYLAISGSRSRDTTYLAAIESVSLRDQNSCTTGCCSVHPATQPSLTSAEAFDSGVLLDPKAAERLIDHARPCYAAARRVETVQAIRALPVLRILISDPGHGEQV